MLAADFFTGFFIFRLVRVLSSGGIGGGDAVFSGFMAVLTGFPGWFLAVISAAAGALIYSLFVLKLSVSDRRTRIPFIPFLAAGTLAVLTVPRIFF